MSHTGSPSASGAPSRTTFPALGSTAVVAVSDPSALAEAERAVRSTVAAFDLACSRFREDSELSAINRSAGRWCSAGPLLLEAVEAALRAARLTDGRVDPTVGQALVALGYDRDFDALQDVLLERRTPRIVAVPGWRTVAVDHDRGAIRLSAGVRIDLGATAKALAADHAAAEAGRLTGTGVLVSLGGDMAVRGPAPADGWRILVTDDHRAGFDAPGQWISLHTGALATSSTITRRWATAAGSAHHLIDPATGHPARSPWRTVSVTAATCLDANIASTAAIVMGEEAQSWLHGLGLPSRLVSGDGEVRRVAGWPAPAELQERRAAA